jgi:hypothetical protein
MVAAGQQCERRLRRGKRGDSVRFSVGDGLSIVARHRVSVNEQPACRDVEHPVFGNAGAGIEGGLGVQVVAKGCVRNFGDEREIAPGRRAFNLIIRAGQDQGVRFGPVGGLIVGGDFDGRLRLHAPTPKTAMSHAKRRVTARACGWFCPTLRMISPSRSS